MENVSNGGKNSQVGPHTIMILCYLASYMLFINKNHKHDAIKHITWDYALNVW